MFESGAYVAAALESVDATLTAAQPQPNGVDLTLDAVFEPAGRGRIGRDVKHVAARDTLSPADGAYRLEPGTYVVRYGEPVCIPADHIGFVLPRSTLLRNACTLDTAVWDAGYEGVGEGRLDVGHGIDIEPGARIAQLVLARADHEGSYDGTYQGEHLE